MDILELVAVVVVVTHVACAFFLLLNQIGQVHLLLRALGVRKRSLKRQPEVRPVVSLQLPIYNERTTVEGLLDAVAELRYPKDRLEVQLLDDSTDETVAIAERKVTELRNRGIDIKHIRRANRQGFKAGALSHGLEQAKGDLLAILDADFRPEPDYLERMVAVLEQNPHWGLAQARWGHLNRDSSVFTSAMALHVDTHFCVEQEARSQAPLFMGFNGTAGIWRKAAIVDAGGWSADSLTEDLDLAFRAQMAGWQLGYVDEIEVPAEVPEQISMIRTQQHRWIKGGTQVCHKLLLDLWRAPQPLLTKLQGTLHLSSSHLFVAVLGLCLVNPMLPVVHDEVSWAPRCLMVSGAAFQFILLSVLAVYLTTCLKRESGLKSALLRWVKTVPWLVSLSSGLSVLATKAVWEAWRGQTSSFVRTAKDGDRTVRAYKATKAGRVAWIELLMATWLTAGVVLAVSRGHHVLAGFLALQSLGFWVMASHSELGLVLPRWVREPSLQTRTDP